MKPTEIKLVENTKMLVGQRRGVDRHRPHSTGRNRRSGS